MRTTFVRPPRRGRRFPAPFSRRAAAYAMDGGIVSLVSIAGGWGGGGLVGILGGSAEDVAASAILVGALATSVYWVALQAGPWQGSIGKRAKGIRIVMRDGSDVDAVVSILRYLASFLSLAPFGLGYLMAAWRDDGAALHDILCGTRVVLDETTEGLGRHRLDDLDVAAVVAGERVAGDAPRP